MLLWNIISTRLIIVAHFGNHLKNFNYLIFFTNFLKPLETLKILGIFGMIIANFYFLWCVYWATYWYLLRKPWEYFENPQKRLLFLMEKVLWTHSVYYPKPSLTNPVGCFMTFWILSYRTNFQSVFHTFPQRTICAHNHVFWWTKQKKNIQIRWLVLNS